MSSSLGARKVKGKSIAPQTGSRKSGLTTIVNIISVIISGLGPRPCLVAQSVKNLPVMQEASGSIPGSGRSPAGGNGNPLQTGPGRATVHRVAKSPTRLSDYTSTPGEVTFPCFFFCPGLSVTPSSFSLSSSPKAPLTPAALDASSQSCLRRAGLLAQALRQGQPQGGEKPRAREEP